MNYADTKLARKIKFFLFKFLFKYNRIYCKFNIFFTNMLISNYKLDMASRATSAQSSSANY